MTVANKVYGVPQTVNAASYIVIKVYKDALELRGIMKDDSSIKTGSTPEEIITEELLNAHRGQGMDILWRDNVKCPTEDEYIDMIKNKTASLFRILIRLMMACATKQKDVDTKGFAEDLTEGKFSFPLVHAIRADTSNTQLLGKSSGSGFHRVSSFVTDIIKQRPKSPTLKRQALSYMEKETKSFEYTLAVLRTLQTRIDEEMKTLGGNFKLEKLLDKLRVK
ncbi:hypothetical protein HHX47_DHR1001533 [Lentinula edodes]|nr:hypothetical protein HHX47_DHR1001533 [Lentinula edodes]